MIDAHFYAEEFPPVKITIKTQYLGNKLLDWLVRRGIREYLVRWRGYGQAFDI
jgi:hypothetical protein